MSVQRTWIIRLGNKNLSKCVENGEEKVLLIGYDNGLSKRKEEKYFLQREKDKDFYLMKFEPEPHFISYTFFAGFFGQTIKNLCAQKDDVEYIGAAKRLALLKQFNDKYRFSFSLNPRLNEIVKDYADELIENEVDMQSKTKGDNTNGFK